MPVPAAPVLTPVPAAPVVPTLPAVPVETPVPAVPVLTPVPAAPVVPIEPALPVAVVPPAPLPGSTAATGARASCGPAAPGRIITEQAPVKPAAGTDRGGHLGPPARRRWLARTAAHPLARHAALLLGFIAAGVVLTWPLATNLTDARLPATRDIGAYVWGFWWIARR